MVRLMLYLQLFNEMDNSGIQSEKQGKEKLIIEAAQKRFGLFGIEKTSMREIADDLNLSKASLYYYFPDKATLYRAVVEKEQNEFVERILERILSIKDADMLLREYSRTRLSYFRTLLNLSRLRLEAYSSLKPVFKDTISSFKKKEKDIIVRILEKGISDSIFFVEDSGQVAELFLELLKGLRISILNDKRSLIIDQDEYEKLLEKTNSFTDMFIRGLKYNSLQIQ
jgi:AcrR family transcriptional regulator